MRCINGTKLKIIIYTGDHKKNTGKIKIKTNRKNTILLLIIEIFCLPQLLKRINFRQNY